MSALWRQTQVVIRGEFGERTVRAWSSSDAPGLVVTDAIGAQRFSGNWVITHASSGLAVRGIEGGFQTREEAGEHAVNLAALTDWTRTSQQLKRERSLGKLVDRAYRSAASAAQHGTRSLPGDEQP